MTRRDTRGRFIPTYTICYNRCTPSGTERTHQHSDRTAPEVERIGALLLRIPEDQLYNLAVLNGRGEDVTFDFPVFQG